MHKNRTLPRLLIGLVAFLNLQCAFLFLFHPGDYLLGFELSGAPGRAAVQGMGVLFVMWNIPYLLAVWNPFHNYAALLAALIMQLTGVLGETWIFMGVPVQNAVLRAAITRFILFDFGGLLLLGWAFALVRRELTRTAELIRS